MSYRLVVDTNIIISAVLTPGSNPDRLFQTVYDGHLQLILSHAILEEARRVFDYSKIRKALNKRAVTTTEIEDFLTKLSQISILVVPETIPNIIKEDPSDNIVLAAALEGHVDFIVSGDQHLTSLKEYRDIRILTPSEFIEEFIGTE
ncbi:MAG: putative toxin-antitoxin system toxin component, PIN family [Desulfatiglans sp.]|nr:putative toxin-antitoxin system toxin component, PIN family [Desulfatiglans sp.]